MRRRETRRSVKSTMWEFLEDEVREVHVGFGRVEVVHQLERSKQFPLLEVLSTRLLDWKMSGS